MNGEFYHNPACAQGTAGYWAPWLVRVEGISVTPNTGGRKKPSNSENWDPRKLGHFPPTGDSKIAWTEVCAYANRQHALSQELTADPREPWANFDTYWPIGSYWSISSVLGKSTC